MAFKKFGKMEILASWEIDPAGTRIAKTAAEAPLPSFYANPGMVGTLDIGQALKKVATEYDISDNPQDYVYEAVRACTAGVANENGDAFSRDELLRFDHRLACAVYQTFILKPHHINHRADNPKTARGVILDSHYNDNTPPLEQCPTCMAHTASREGRDRTGLYCRACGTCVKDEFIEILLGVDKTKDPSFADGVRTGTLNATSMGCFVPGTLITLADGSRKAIETIVPGDLVITHTGAISEVDETSVHDCDDEIVSIGVAGVQADIVATLDHPFWVVNPETQVGEWKHAHAVRRGDYLLSPAVRLETKEVDIKFARLAGYFAAEGNFVKAYDGALSGKRVGIEFTFNANETKYLDEVQQLLIDLGADPKRYERADRNIGVVKAYRCQELADRLYDAVGEHAHNKHLSDEVLSWPADAQLAFIGALINGDGFGIHEYGHSWTQFTTVSADLCDQVSQILVNLGVPHRTSVTAKRSGFGSERPVYDLHITGDYQLKLANYSDKVVKTATSGNHMVASRPVAAGILRKVSHNKPVMYAGKVYNFGVKHEDHSYVAGGIAVHNCVCDSTTCNVCDHIAFNRNEFCDHIRGGNKKKTFKTASGEKVAFEWCNNVTFTEQSRVDQPADPKALQTEILELAAKKTAEEHKPADLRNETELLKLSKRLVELESKVAQMKKAAQADAPTQVEEKAPEPGTIGAYVQEKKDKDKNAEPLSPDAVGIEEEVGPSSSSMYNITSSIADNYLSEIDAVINRTNATKGARNMDQYKFKQAYKDLRLQVTKQGNFRVHNDRGTLFVVQPQEKLATAKERTDAGVNIMRHIAEHGLVAAMKKFNAVLAPKVAQVLEFNVNDMGKAGPKDGDKGPITNDNVDNFTDARAKPKSDLQKDNVDNFTDKRVTPQTEIVQEHVEDLEGGREMPKDIKDLGSVTTEDGLAAREVHPPKSKGNNALDGATGDMQGNPRGAPGKKVTAEVEKEAKRPEWLKKFDSKSTSKSTSKAPSASKSKSASKPKAEAAASKSKSKPAFLNKSASKHCTGCNKSPSKCACTASKKAKTAGIEVTAETKKYESRLERLYKRRYAQLEQEQNKKVAEVVDVVADKFKKALRLATARQQLNLEMSPIKAAFAETLLAPMDLTGDEYYPGMDQHLAVTLTEKAASVGFEEFVDQTVARAAELMKLSDDAFIALEADVKHLQPVAPPIVEDNQLDHRAEKARTAARQGNLQVAPAPTDHFAAPRGQRHDRSGIRGALGNTKIHRTGITLQQNDE